MEKEPLPFIRKIVGTEHPDYPWLFHWYILMLSCPVAELSKITILSLERYQNKTSNDGLIIVICKPPFTQKTLFNFHLHYLEFNCIYSLRQHCLWLLHFLRVCLGENHGPIAISWYIAHSYQLIFTNKTAVNLCSFCSISKSHTRPPIHDTQ